MNHEQKDLVVSVLIHFVTMGILGGLLIVITLAWPGQLVALGFALAVLIECWRPAFDGDVVNNRITCGLISLIAVVLAGLATKTNASFGVALMVMSGVIVPAVVFLIDRYDAPKYPYGDGYHPTSVKPVIPKNR